MKADKEILEETKKYGDKELNDRIAKAKRKSVDKFIKKLGFPDECSLQNALHVDREEGLLRSIHELEITNALLLKDIKTYSMSNKMYEYHVDPAYFEFILYQLQHKSDADNFEAILKEYLSDHPQFCIKSEIEDRVQPFLLLYKR